MCEGNNHVGNSPDNTQCDPVSLLNKIKNSISSLVPKTKKKDLDKVLSDIDAVINTISSDKITLAESNLLARINNALNESTTKTRPSYADKASKPATLKAYVVKPLTPGDNIDEISKKLKTHLRQNKETNIDSMVVNQNNIRILSNDSQLKTKINQAIISAELDKNVEITELSKLKPQISLMIPTDQLEDAETIKMRNNIPQSEDFDIIVNNEIKTKSRYKKNYVIIRMSKNARQIIQQRSRLYIGCESIEFRDNFNVRNCFNCNRIGHTAKYCDATPSCRRCEKDHNTNKCEIEEQDKSSTKCHFCKNAGFKNLDHKYKSPQCSSYNQAINRLKNIIDFEYEN
ncbi:uncharacterized protein LOC107360945 [Tetranychus urticae]|uniref:uncharacterized protein LOC107360945 n=1 Tax=Tetranychus urticae TaxID=32264 RepID=UPI00077BEC2D|nr:uncharacterized protein LOC107360945 [Tetranychus urticae]